MLLASIRLTNSIDTYFMSNGLFPLGSLSYLTYAFIPVRGKWANEGSADGGCSNV